MRSILKMIVVGLLTIPGMVSCGTSKQHDTVEKSELDKKGQIYATCEDENDVLTSDFYRFDNSDEFQYYLNTGSEFNSPVELYVVKATSICKAGVQHLVQLGEAHRIPIVTQKKDEGQTYFLTIQQDAIYVVGDHDTSDRVKTLAPICSGALDGECEFGIGITEDHKVTLSIKYRGDSILEYEWKLDNITKEIAILGLGGSKND